MAKTSRETTSWGFKPPEKPQRIYAIAFVPQVDVDNRLDIHLSTVLYSYLFTVSLLLVYNQ
jgi:hypothetical protein